MKRPKTDYKGFYENLVEQIQSYKGKKEEIIELAPELFKLMTQAVDLTQGFHKKSLIEM